MLNEKGLEDCGSWQSLPEGFHHPQHPPTMNYIHQNSYIVPGTPGYRLVENSSETRPAAGEASALSGESGDMIALSYSHGKPSNSSHVMTPVRGTFILPELPEGGTHTVVASGKVDDSVSLTVDDSSASSTSGATHSFSLSIEGLPARRPQTRRRPPQHRLLPGPHGQHLRHLRQRRPVPPLRNRTG